MADLEAHRSQGIKQPLLVTPTGEADIDGMASTASSLATAGSPPLNRPDSHPCRPSSKDDARREREVMLVENSTPPIPCPSRRPTVIRGSDLGVGVGRTWPTRLDDSDRFVRRRLRIAHIPQETRDVAARSSQTKLDRAHRLAEIQSTPTPAPARPRRPFRLDLPAALPERLSRMARQGEKALAKAGIKVESFPDGKNWNGIRTDTGRPHDIQHRTDFWTSFTRESD